MSKYYVYILIDPRTGLPFYVGKGKGLRMYAHKQEALSIHFKTKPHHKRIIEIINEGLDLVYAKALKNATEEEALTYERILIDRLGRTNRGTGPLLNLTCGGQRGGNVNAKPVCQYTLTGSFVREWASAKEASENVPANRSYITQVCKGKRKSAGGFLWAYKGNPPPSFSKNYYRSVQQLDITGTVLSTFRSLTEAQSLTGVELHNISECCRGKSKTAGGYVWKYLDM